MFVHFTPQRRDDVITSASVDGDVITINGDAYDFGPLTEGAELPASATDCSFLTGTITRTDGQIHLWLIVPLGIEGGRLPEDPFQFIDGTGPVILPEAIND